LADLAGYMEFDLVSESRTDLRPDSVYEPIQGVLIRFITAAEKTQARGRLVLGISLAEHRALRWLESVGDDDHGPLGHEMTQPISIPILDREDRVEAGEPSDLLTRIDDVRGSRSGGLVALGSFVQNVVRVDPVAAGVDPSTTWVDRIGESRKFDDHDSRLAVFDHRLNECASCRGILILDIDGRDPKRRICAP
jgi:hypothetical protein